MNVGLYSYAFNDLNCDITYYQRLVFSKFNLKINQIIFDKNSNLPNDHALGLTEIIKTASEDYLIIFDIDCIPINKSFYNIILSDIFDKNTLAGAVGCANHIDPNKIYVHPCFMAFYKNLYFECECPSLYAYENGDVAQRFTDVCILKNKNIKYWDVTDSDDKIWNLNPKNKKFGHGTIFNNLIYHQYQIRMKTQQQCFINKCKEILSRN